jgi:hypothetical protein
MTLGLSNLLTLDIIVLTKDNPAELNTTLSSIPVSPPWLLTRVLVIDGGTNVALEEQIPQLLCPSHAYLYINTAKAAIRGIYPSMNYALLNVKSDWFMFLNSGDHISSGFCFSSIKQNLEDKSLSVIFGQARIVHPYSGVTWFMPDPAVRNIARWLHFFEPNHQAMFVSGKIAKKFKFDLDSPVAADAAWKRAILRSEPYCYQRECFVDFYLGGISSSYGFRLMLQKIQEPARRPIEKLMEIFKTLLFLFGIMTPRLQLIKSRAIAVLFFG